MNLTENFHLLFKTLNFIIFEKFYSVLSEQLGDLRFFHRAILTQHAILYLCIYCPLCFVSESLKLLQGSATYLVTFGAVYVYTNIQNPLYFKIQSHCPRFCLH